MKKFDLSLYKESKQYFFLYDAYLKSLSINKEDLFDSIDITPSSYRRARISEQNIGVEIIKQLSNHFSFKLMKNSQLDDLEDFIQKVYDNMYYKIYSSYDEDLQYIDSLIKRNYLVFPILNLIKLFLCVNSKKSLNDVYNENIELYNNVKIYKNFFVGDLKSILELVTIFFNDDYKEEEWLKNYDDAMTYQIIASKCLKKGKYIETIFYANKAKEILVKEQNFKRLFNINNAIMYSLLFVGNYEECFSLSSSQILSYRSFNNEEELLNASNYQIVSLLGLKKYNEVLKKLKCNKEFDLTLLTCFLVSMYCNNKTEYQNYYNKEIEIDKYEENDKMVFKIINSVLTHNDKRQLFKLEKMDIMPQVILILKKI